MVRLLLLLLVAVSVVSCVRQPEPVSYVVTAPPVVRQPEPTRPPISYGAKSVALKPGMSEKQVIEVLGNPARADLLTCGQKAGTPWQCKLWEYGTFLSGISITFRDDRLGAWVVNSWEVRVL